MRFEEEEEEEENNACRLLVGEPLEGRRRTWEDDIRMDLREIEWGCMDLIDMAYITD
jgi:hypothetical protein